VTNRAIWRPAPALAVVLSLLVAGACSGRDPYAPLARPDPVDPVETTTTTEPIDYASIQLPGVQGTTTTSVAMGSGPITIVGRVEGPDGPVEGARVRLERLVGDGSASVEVPTAADGTWNVAGVLGGRYRVRAWQQPSLAMVRAQVVFIEAGEQRPVLLRLDRYEGRRVDAVIAPDPPLVGEAANLKVRVADRAVDDRGVVRTRPVAGATVQLTGTGRWFVMSPNPQATGTDGSVTFRVECGDEGAQPLSAVVDGGDVVPLPLPDCVDASAPPPTTTSPTTTTSTSTTSTTSTTEPDGDGDD
jgi:hypothetical protein